MVSIVKGPEATTMNMGDFSVAMSQGSLVMVKGRGSDAKSIILDADQGTALMMFLNGSLEGNWRGLEVWDETNS